MSVYTKQDEVEIGSVWKVRWHDGSFTEVEIVGIKRFPIRQYRPAQGGYITTGSKTRYSAKNLKTGRYVEIKSAAKLRERVR